MRKNIIIAGGGAAGFFAAVNIAEKLPECSVTILEKSSSLLSKVKISGGGRCNVTNKISDPKKLVEFYPRGNKELLSAFYRFSTNNTAEWFEKRKVKLKTEADGRVFPATDSSQTIVDCLINSAEKAGVNIITGVNIKNMFPSEQDGRWIVECGDKNFLADVLVAASGNNEQMWKLLQNAGHKIEKPVPSLFTFNVNDSRIKNIPGISLKDVEVKIEGSKISAAGDILITHKGLSGPAILRLSAWGARELYKKDYRFNLIINWINKKTEDVKTLLAEHRKSNLNKIILTNPLFNVPLRLWEKLALHSCCDEKMKWQGASKAVLMHLAEELTAGCYNAAGKSANKEEFVTCGGVSLKEVDFKTMQSKLFNNLYFAGEVLNIDAVTGGFNFQAAWTTAWIASESIAG